jgi:hypothetical protein
MVPLREVEFPMKKFTYFCVKIEQDKNLYDHNNCSDRK